MPSFEVHEVGSVNAEWHGALVRELGASHQPGKGSAMVLLCGPMAEGALDAVQRCNAQGRRAYVACDTSMSPATARWECLRAGAADVLPWTSAREVRAQLEARELRREAIDNVLAWPVVRDHVVGTSPAWRALVHRVVEAARFTTAPILLLGESGTGKELLARLVHTVSPGAREGGLVVLDCSTVVPELSGSEFFGHERGAFTGAVSAREGAFALADGGTLFLDEVGELPLPQQAQLLRAIEERTFKKVGSNAWQRASFRLVCATNRDLAADVRSGRFRGDLYARIASWVCRLPPLRDRREDVLPLAQHFLRDDNGSPGPSLDPDVAQYLTGREYDGNVRELRLLVQRIRQRHVGDGPVTMGDVPEADWPAGGAPADGGFLGELDALVRNAVAAGIGLKEINRAAAMAAHHAALSQCGGRTGEAARLLGVTPRALQLRQRRGSRAGASGEPRGARGRAS